MGLYDRDYSRDDEDWGYSEYGSRPRSVQSMTVALIVVNVVVYLADQIFSPDHRLMYSLALAPESVGRPWMWWQFLTAAFAHSPNGLGHLFWNMFALFIFGRDVEGRLGRHEFLRFYLLSALTGNVIFAILRYAFADLTVLGPLLGASGAVTAVTILYICYFPRNTLLLFFVLPVPAWIVGVLVIVGDMLGAMSTPPPGVPRVAHDVHLAGAAFAFLYWKLNWRLGTIMPTEWLGNLKKWLTRPRLKIHDPEPTYENLDAEADRVLEKVHREGEASLTPPERRVLEDYSRRMRQKLR